MNLTLRILQLLRTREPACTERLPEDIAAALTALQAFAQSKPFEKLVADAIRERHCGAALKEGGEVDGTGRMTAGDGETLQLDGTAEKQTMTREEARALWLERRRLI
jgi:hypothetical protein